MPGKPERLLALMDLFRQHRRPVTGAALAERLGVSKRTIYRDIEGLRALGMAVDGEAGTGFQLRGEVFLPPMTLESDEVEALTLGLRGQLHGPDAQLRAAARAVLSKIAEVLPEGRRQEMEGLGLFALPREVRDNPHLATIRQALRDGFALDLTYADKAGEETRRRIWPVALGYLSDRQDLIAWCCLRQDYRRFVTERMVALSLTEERPMVPRRTLFHRWVQQNNLPDIT